MTRPFRLLLLVGFLFVIAALAGPALAADGFPVCNVEGNQASPAMTVASDGAIWIAWIDERVTSPFSYRDVYVKRLDPIVFSSIAGEMSLLPPPQDPADGVPVREGIFAQYVSIVSSNNGSVLVLWGQNSPQSIYAQRVLPNETVDPAWPAGGKQLAGGALVDASLWACTDGAGGAYFARKQWGASPESQHIRLQRIDADGDLLWPEPSLIITGNFRVTHASLSFDPAGAVVVTAWNYFQFPGGQSIGGAAARVAPNGTVLVSEVLTGWQAPQGNAAVSSFAVTDGAGGLIAAWNRPGTKSIQRWSGNGDALWAHEPTVPGVLPILPDGLGGVYALGNNASSPFELIALRLDGSGTVTPGWNPGGNVLSGPYSAVDIGATPLADGFMAFWAEDRGAGNEHDVRALAVKANGTLHEGWLAGGLAISDVDGSQRSVVGALGTTALAWVDERDAETGRDIWVALAPLPSGGVDVPPIASGLRTLRIRALFPNPTRDHVALDLTLRRDQPARVDLHDLRGRLVHRTSIPSSSDEVRATVPTRGLPAGLYWVRVHQGEESAHARVIVLQ